MDFDIKNIRIQDFSYELPNEKIAFHPKTSRDQSKLLLYKNEQIQEHIFSDVTNLLPENALLVVNSTKVVHARMIFFTDTNAKIELFFLEPYKQSVELALQAKSEVQILCLVGNKRKWRQANLAKSLEIQGKSVQLSAELINNHEDAYIVKLNWDSEHAFSEILEQAGKIPLPPYIKRNVSENDENSYQTIFANSPGSVAAPTAALHFSEAILEKLKAKLDVAKLTLHVGAGTFKPVKTDTIGKHNMHFEHFRISTDLLKIIIKKKCDNLPIIATGTTSTRALESLIYLSHKLQCGYDHQTLYQWEVYDYQDFVRKDEIALLESLLFNLEKNNLNSFEAKTQLMIVPSFKFRIVDAIFTNFHQPQSTLLLLVAALVGEDWQKVYDFALQNDFRFLSYGDSSLLWR